MTHEKTIICCRVRISSLVSKVAGEMDTLISFRTKISYAIGTMCRNDPLEKPATSAQHVHRTRMDVCIQERKPRPTKLQLSAWVTSEEESMKTTTFAKQKVVVLIFKFGQSDKLVEFCQLWRVPSNVTKYQPQSQFPGSIFICGFHSAIFERKSIDCSILQICQSSDSPIRANWILTGMDLQSIVQNLDTCPYFNGQG